MRARWLAYLTALLPACSCGDSMPRAMHPPDAAMGTPDEGVAPADAFVDEPVTCVVRCEPIETVAIDSGTGPFVQVPVTPLVALPRGFAVLFRGTMFGALPDERSGPLEFHQYLVVLDERAGAIRSPAGWIQDDQLFDVVEGVTLHAIPDGLEAVFVHAPDPRPIDTDPRAPPRDSAVHVTVARWDEAGETVSLYPLGTMDVSVPACDCRGTVALDARGQHGVAAVALRGMVRAAALDLGAVPTMGETIDVMPVGPTLERTSSLSVAMLSDEELVLVGGGSGLDRDALIPFGARTRLDPVRVSPIAITGGLADEPPIVRAWRDGFVVARHARPSGDVGAGAMRLAFHDAAGALMREVVVPTASGIPPVALDIVVGPDGEAAMVWLARSPDGTPEVAVNVTPLDVPAACDVLEVAPAGALPARLAAPVMSAAARGDAVDLFTVGDSRTWSRVSSCTVEVP